MSRKIEAKCRRGTYLRERSGLSREKKGEVSAPRTSEGQQLRKEGTLSRVGDSSEGGIEGSSNRHREETTAPKNVRFQVLSMLDQGKTAGRGSQSHLQRSRHQVGLRIG